MRLPRGAVAETFVPGADAILVQHERIGIEVSSYYLVRDWVAIDPMLPAEGLAWFGERGVPTAILLTNLHHYRASGALAEDGRMLTEQGFPHANSGCANP